MATNYTGDRTATEAPSSAPGESVSPIVVLPADGDARNAASIAQAFKACADFLDWLTHHGVWRDVATTISSLLSIAVSGDSNPSLDFTTVPTTRKLLLRFHTGGSPAVKVRLYSVLTGGFEITLNCAWNSGTSQWDQDDGSGYFAVRLALEAGGSYNFRLYRYSGTGSFANTAWDYTAFIDILASGICVSGDIVATGSVSAPHHLGGGSTPSYTLYSGAGTSASCAIAGSDTAGLIHLTTGTGPAQANILALSFATAFASAPKVMLVPADYATWNLAATSSAMPYINPSSGITTTYFMITANNALAASTNYYWSYLVIG